jgi:branched-subunit amino acid transport protein
MSRRVSFAALAVLLAAIIAILFFFAPGYVSSSAAAVSSESRETVSVGTFIPLFITMTVTTYLMRMVPFVLFRRKLTNPKVKAFFDYIPYTVLSAMTFPAILYSTGSVPAAVAGLAVALALSFMEKSLLVVAIGTCIGSLAVSVLLMYI